MVALTKWLLALGTLVWAATAWTQTETRQAETRIKAAFLYRFGDFVEWPAAALGRTDGPFTIGVAGADDLAAELERVVATRTIQGRPVVVKRLRRGEPLGGIHMLFLAEGEVARNSDIVNEAHRRSILTVTEGNQGLASGSVISFVTDDERVRFDIALPAAERSQLKISSRLLTVARRVVTG